uniref:Fibronectin type-III domain-containing protein n=1 Tax=Strigamia maritima TaxID=126957 RepID=T1J5K5_STRMM
KLNLNSCILLSLFLFLLSPLGWSMEATLPGAEVEDLQAVADYHAFLLTWKFPLGPRGQFVVRYCEATNTLWQHCERKIFNETETEPKLLPPSSGSIWRFGAMLDGLRLGTKYKILVTMHAQNEEREFLWPKKPRRWLNVSTKGFVARVARCLPEFTEVLVDTGPFFRGRIEVEGANDMRCHIKGEAKSPRTQYVFIISHDLCASRQSGQFVQSIIIANESPTLITQSSRRFNLICDLLPDPFTLQTIVNLTDSAPVRDAAQADMILERNFEDALYQTRDDADLSPVVAAGMVIVLLVMAAGAGFAWASVRRWKTRVSQENEDRATILPARDVNTISSLESAPQIGQISLMAHRPLETA